MEVDCLGQKVNRVYFPNVTGKLNYKQRLELSKSTKFKNKLGGILPNIKIKKKFSKCEGVDWRNCKEEFIFYPISM